ncbi:heparan-alpha-glucosaminide N-acetyltransferase domain-containing protein [Ulvibacterium sp.]|uniref:heparan-alpha-glucosaminide N-acetyltransferase domain-containing protein n=1 Tax=Ulvibacterium sp. TaxID=2665914 RepID=UPI003BA873BB
MKNTGTASPNLRIRTIDVLRALTMFLMIFVNDLWSLTGVPKWLEHTLAEEDGMGFSDVIFPLFLFIVGLSIPLAIDVRFKRKETNTAILGHILMRTIALLVMGFYMVNYGVINEEATGLDKNIWQILMATAIFLIWLDYKRLPNLRKALVWGLQALGLLILIYLAWIYRGGALEDINWMRPRWWGILGLIGWAYLLNGLLYLVIRKRVIYWVPIFLLLLFMNIQENNHFESLPSFKLVISASNHVLVMAGLLCTVFYLKSKKAGKRISQFLSLVALASGLFILFGFWIRPAFPISKILATPSWTAICIGINLLSYVLLYILVDWWGYSKWADPIKAAGTSTLTCYLMPYFIYPTIVLVGFQWPEFLSDGFMGIVKSLLFSLVIILLVRLLEKRNIRLKI